MVQLTSTLCKYMPSWMKYFERRVFLRKQALFKLTYSQYGRKRNCWKRAQQNLYVQYRKELENRKKDHHKMRHLNSARVIAACEELNYPFGKFVTKLPMLGVELDRKSLANLAIWEPRSFESLVEIAKKFDPEDYQNLK